MIPVRLAVQGLYSYQERQEVDFQKLTNTSLFGIFGQVGSGKTSLLEAISFVLYGETERLNGRDNRQYNMMNLKSGHMVIDFEFRAGAGHELYKYVYEAKRNAKKHQEIKAGERRVFQWQETGWVPVSIEREDIGQFTQQLIGLDYDNFKRTIIIPQNQFREFLELSPKERTDMMSRLFQLNKFDLSAQVASLEKKNNTELDFVKGQLDGLGQASPEAIDDAWKQIQQVISDIQALDQQIGVQKKQEEQLIGLKKRHDELAKAQQELTALAGQQARYDELQRRVRQYEQCLVLFKPLLSQINEQTNKQNSTNRSIQAIQHELSIARQTLTTLQQDYDKAKIAYEQREVIREQLDELDTVILIQNNRNAISRHEKDLARAKRDVETITREIEQQTGQQTALQKKVSAFSQDESRIDQLNEIRLWFTGYRPLKEKIDGFDRKIAENEKAQEQIKQRKDEALQGFPAEWADLQLKVLPDTIEEAFSRLKSQRDERKRLLDDLLLKQHLQRYANALTDGKPCPLCGSEHHPAVHQDSTIDDEVTKAQGMLVRWENRLDQTMNLKAAITGLLGEIKTVFGQTRQLINEKAEAVMAKNEHERLFVWQEFTTDQEQEVKQALFREQEKQKQLGEARKQLDALNEQLAKAEKDRFSLLTKQTETVTLIASLRETIQEKLNTLRHFQENQIAPLDITEISDLKDKLSTKYTRAKEQFDDITQNLDKARQQNARLDGQLEELTKQLQTLQTELAKTTRELEQTLAGHAYDRPAVEQILRADLNVAHEKKNLDSFYAELEACRRTVEKLSDELAGQPFDAALLQAVTARLRQMQQDSNALHQSLGTKQNAHKELVQQWELKQDIQKQFDALTIRQKDLKELEGLFRGQGFVKYVSTVYLNELCQTANERFMRLTKNQLRLEYDDNNFVIRDFLNGGKTRLAKTLSGGQMFQAALSLALALSDNIQHLTQSKQNLFFLDEGFGSLDKNSLETVFDTLKSLRRENRIVGIISHVEELQQEIDTYIRTVHSEHGSVIKCSWD
ncbi:AAA family ATPase [Arsenicibacter rosenii]|uniref:Rad50/SbcC-type AAA domain-containing protein n=1 Tax=Arsenicibacter rosenii TaxID=1750698 RepID=A0A1S2VFK0_9BACT|nr:SMC family ATPase [Arsenicibacter rosenii]OIN57065.1 hypothetical protein BLX24_21110 [Arsenicibacter rosenii]